MSPIKVHDERVSEGILTMLKSQKVKTVHQDELLTIVGHQNTEVEFAYCFALDLCDLKNSLSISEEVLVSDDNSLLQVINTKLSNEVTEFSVQDCLGTLQVNSFHLAVCKNDNCPYRTLLGELYL